MRRDAYDADRALRAIQRVDHLAAVVEAEGQLHLAVSDMLKEAARELLDVMPDSVEPGPAEMTTTEHALDH